MYGISSNRSPPTVFEQLPQVTVRGRLQSHARRGKVDPSRVDEVRTLKLLETKEVRAKVNQARLEIELKRQGERDRKVQKEREREREAGVKTATIQ